MVKSHQLSASNPHFQGPVFRSKSSYISMKIAAPRSHGPQTIENPVKTGHKSSWNLCQFAVEISAIESKRSDCVRLFLLKIQISGHQMKSDWTSSREPRGFWFLSRSIFRLNIDLCWFHILIHDPCSAGTSDVIRIQVSSGRVIQCDLTKKFDFHDLGCWHRQLRLDHDV